MPRAKLNKLTITFVGFAIGAMHLGCACKPNLPPPLTHEATAQDDFFRSPLNQSADQPQSDVLAPINRETEVRPGFLIQLASRMDSHLRAAYRVDLAGNLQLPYQTEVHAAGLSIESLQTRVNQALGGFFKVAPNITCSIKERKFWIDVRGLIQKPGPVLIEPNTKLGEVLAKAGGLVAESKVQTMEVRRGVNHYEFDLRAGFLQTGIVQGGSADAEDLWVRSPNWRGGEQIILTAGAPTQLLSQMSSVQILGDVRAPGSYGFKTGGDLYDYLALAGGPSPTSDLEKIQVVRQITGGKATTMGTAKDISKSIVLAQGDMVIVGSVHPGAFERSLQIGSTVAALISALALLLYLH